MSYGQDPYQMSQAPMWGGFAAQAAPNERAAFIKKTYLNLFGAIVAFCGLEAVYLNTSFAGDVMQRMVNGGNMGLIVAFILFMVCSWVARSWAASSTSVGMQYAGLGLYVVAQSFIFIPILYYAAHFGGNNVIPTAATITLLLFAGLTAAVFITGHDFSFLRTGLIVASVGLFGLILCSWLFGFNLGTLFTVGVIVLACGYILYDTSNVLHQYQIGQHVAAALALFASVALLFMYILQLVMQSQSRR
jgi:FtsH-binding integral membrane protein